MRYKNAQDFLADPRKSVLVFGMSGVGKSYVSDVLSNRDGWQSHSIDMRIGQLLEKHILADYSYTERDGIRSRLQDGDLGPLVAYLGKPGSRKLGGRTFFDYQDRLVKHAQAEHFALAEAPSHFDVVRSEKNQRLDFICDTGGSMCEVLSPKDDKRLLSALSHRMLFVYIEADETYDKTLVDRFVSDPKPMYYQPEFLSCKWNEYLDLTGATEAEVDPDAFSKWGFGQLVHHRRPLYEAIAKRWGVTVSAREVSAISDTQDFLELLCGAIEKKKSKARAYSVSAGKNFAHQRRHLNLTKKALATLVGVDEQYISRFENDRVQLSEKLESEIYQILYIQWVAVQKDRQSYQSIVNSLVNKKKRQRHLSLNKKTHSLQ